MSKSKYLYPLLFLVPLAAAACEDEPLEKPGDAIDDTVDVVDDAIEDAADAVDDATKKVDGK